MNVDQSIFRMAYREAESLGVAQALVARKRQDFELRLLRQKVQEGTGPSGAAIDSTLRRMDEQSHERAAEYADEPGAVVDKTA